MDIKNELLKIIEEDVPKNLTLEQKKKIDNLYKELSKERKRKG